jgi:hypothetical protein
MNTQITLEFAQLDETNGDHTHYRAVFINDGTIDQVLNQFSMLLKSLGYGDYKVGASTTFTNGETVEHWSDY